MVQLKCDPLPSTYQRTSIKRFHSVGHNHAGPFSSPACDPTYLLVCVQPWMKSFTNQAVIPQKRPSLYLGWPSEGAPACQHARERMGSWRALCRASQSTGCLPPSGQTSRQGRQDPDQPASLPTPQHPGIGPGTIKGWLCLVSDAKRHVKSFISLFWDLPWGV